jgi:hypothetical protein
MHACWAKKTDNPQRTMMKKLLIVLFLVFLPVDGFAPHGQVAKNEASATFLKTAKRDEISQELEELGGEKIRPRVTHEKRGFNEFHETLVHKLRHALHEKDVLLHEALDELEDALRKQKAYEVAWESTEVDLKRETDLYEKEHESIRRLLGQAVKLAYRRIKNGVKRMFRRK